MPDPIRGRKAEVHPPGPGLAPSGWEEHCIRPGKYEFTVKHNGIVVKRFWVNYVGMVSRDPSGLSAGAYQVTNTTANTVEGLEATDQDDTVNVWIDLFVHVDRTANPAFWDNPILDVENAANDPTDSLFANETAPAGSVLDWFRFSATRSTTNWVRGTENEERGGILSRIYWDLDRGLDRSTHYYDSHSVGEHVLRVHQFADHVEETRAVRVALETMRPDEAPDDTIHVHTRIVQVTVNTPPTASFTYSCQGLSCTFVDTSTDPGGSVVAWDWAFGDGGSSSQQHPVHAFPGSGSYLVRLVVTDNGALADTASQTLVRDLVSISGPDYITTPKTYIWTASVTGGTPPFSYQWWYRPFVGGSWTAVGMAQTYKLYVGYANLGFSLRGRDRRRRGDGGGHPGRLN